MNEIDMFIAHLPAGYLASHYFLKKRHDYKLSYKQVLVITLLGSILPDLDLIYFYLIDARQHNHHSYWSHIPIFWFAIYAFMSALLFIFNNKKLIFVSTILITQIMLHLVLDTAAGRA